MTRSPVPLRSQIVDAGSGGSVEVHKTGFPDAVVWNPWWVVPGERGGLPCAPQPA